MSLTPYPHKVIVTTKKRTEDAAGAPVISDDKTFTIAGRMQQISSKEVEAAGGHKLETIFRFTCDAWPGGPKSTATWNGRKFAQVGEADERSSSVASHRWKVNLRALDAVFK